MKWMVLVCITIAALALAMAPCQGAVAAIGEKTGHFTIKYDSPEAFTPGTGKVLEDSYHKVNGLIGHLPSSIKVLIVDGGRMDDYGKHVEAFSAWNSRSSTIVLREETLKDKKSLGVVATHEICHLGLNSILQGKDAGEYEWMEEGICMVVSDEPLDDVKVARYIVSKGFMDLPEITRAIDCDDYSVCKNGYLQSFSLCRHITRIFGTDALIDIVKSPDPDFKRAFKTRTGVDFTAFYNGWKSMVRSRARETPGPSVIVIHGCPILDDVH
jgi:hypothetical protein